APGDVGFVMKERTMSATTETLKLPAIAKREKTTEEQKKTTVEPKSAEQKRPAFKRPAFRIALVAAALAALAVGFGYYLRARAYDTTDDAFIDGSGVQLSPK